MTFFHTSQYYDKWVWLTIEGVVVRFVLEGRVNLEEKKVSKSYGSVKLPYRPVAGVWQ
jgi:hypothetical protein